MKKSRTDPPPCDGIFEHESLPQRAVFMQFGEGSREAVGAVFLCFRSADLGSQGVLSPSSLIFTRTCCSSLGNQGLSPINWPSLQGEKNGPLLQLKWSFLLACLAQFRETLLVSGANLVPPSPCPHSPFHRAHGACNDWKGETAF